MKKRLFLIAFLLLVATDSALAQNVGASPLGVVGGGSYAARLVQLMGLATILSVAPGIVVTLTSFTRFVIAFSFLRTGLGLQSTPANLVMVALALFMTFFAMAPTLDRSWQEGIAPLIDQKIDEAQAFERATTPLREFMIRQVRPKDLDLFESYYDQLFVWNRAPDLRVLVPAYMISELRRGFEIGFLIALPFLIIDLVVATLVMSAGMMMMPPSVIALPVKVVFFVLIDGWNLLVGNLIRSVQ